MQIQNSQSNRFGLLTIHESAFAPFDIESNQRGIISHHKGRFCPKQMNCEMTLFRNYYSSKMQQRLLSGVCVCDDLQHPNCVHNTNAHNDYSIRVQLIVRGDHRKLRYTLTCVFFTIHHYGH